MHSTPIKQDSTRTESQRGALAKLGEVGEQRQDEECDDKRAKDLEVHAPCSRMLHSLSAADRIKD